MDYMIAFKQKLDSSLSLVANLVISTSVLYIIIYHALEKKPFLPLQFDLKIYFMCLIFTMIIVSIPSLIIHKMELN